MSFPPIVTQTKHVPHRLDQQLYIFTLLRICVNVWQKVTSLDKPDSRWRLDFRVYISVSAASSRWIISQDRVTWQPDRWSYLWPASHCAAVGRVACVVSVLNYVSLHVYIHSHLVKWNYSRASQLREDHLETFLLNNQTMQCSAHGTFLSIWSQRYDGFHDSA